MNPDEPLKRNGLSPRAKQILVGLGGALALLLGALLIYSVLVTPEKQPYRDALSQYKNVYEANIAFTNAGAALNGSASPTDTQLKENAAMIETAKKNLQSANDALGKQAVLQDGEGKNLFEAFSSKLKAYIAHNENILNSRQTVRPVLASEKCAQAMTSKEEYASKVTAMRDCTASLEKLKDIPDQDYKALVDAYKKEYAKLTSTFEKITALLNPKGADSTRYQELVDQHDAILQDIEEVNKTFASDLQKHKAEVDITESAMALDKYLSDKSSVF